MEFGQATFLYIDKLLKTHVRKKRVNRQTIHWPSIFLFYYWFPIQRNPDFLFFKSHLLESSFPPFPSTLSSSYLFFFPSILLITSFFTLPLFTQRSPSPNDNPLSQRPNPGIRQQLGVRWMGKKSNQLEFQNEYLWGKEQTIVLGPRAFVFVFA